jgi:hypothetical protein
MLSRNDNLIANNHYYYFVARIEGQRNLLADYMNNFNREGQLKGNCTPNKDKLTLADLKNYREKSNKTFLIDKESDYSKC